MNPLVSIIVPTKNSEKFLEQCLESIKNQTYKNFELIVVDNNSTDNTKKIAKKYTDKIFNKEPERSTQRNFGASQSNGDYVLFIDSDMVLSSKVVESCIKKIQENELIKGIIIPEESIGEGFWAKCKKLERSFYVGVDWMEAARFFRKNVYQKTGGYDENMVSGEDWDLSQRVEIFGKLDRINDYIYHNEGRIILIKIVGKKIYYASQFSKYKEKNFNKEKIVKQTGVINRYKLFLSQPKKLFKDPVVGLGMLFMKTCEFGFGGMGYFVGKFRK